MAHKHTADASKPASAVTTAAPTRERGLRETERSRQERAAAEAAAQAAPTPDVIGFAKPAAAEPDAPAAAATSATPADTPPAAAAPAASTARARSKQALTDEEEEALLAAGNAPKKKENDVPAAPADAAAAKKEGEAKPVDGLRSMLGEPKKKEQEPEEPIVEFEDLRKPRPEIQVTATEPKVMEEYALKSNPGPELDFSQTIQKAFAGWRVRDVQIQQTLLLTEHRGRSDVLQLNPMNDKLPAKLQAAVEIPKAFAGKRPMVRFEISTKDTGYDWLLSVRAKGVEIFPKTPVRLGKDQQWQDVAVDLSPLAGKHFELSLEVYMSPKTNAKRFPTELGYIRNVRITYNK